MNPLLKDLGLPAIIALLVTGIVNLVSNWWLSDYKKEIDKELADYKTDSDKLIKALESKLRFNESRLVSLHTKRLAMIESTYQNIINLKKDMERFVSDRESEEIEDFRTEEWKIINDLGTSFKKYEEELLVNKLYFTSELASKLLTISESYNTAFSDIYDFQNTLRSEDLDDDEFDTLKVKKVLGEKIIVNEMPKVIQEIEAEFRGILGVE